jgi:hypothetical protein
MSMEGATALVNECVDKRSAGVALKVHRPNAGPGDIQLDQTLLHEVLCQVRIATGEGGARTQEGRSVGLDESPELYVTSLHDEG